MSTSSGRTAAAQLPGLRLPCLRSPALGLAALALVAGCGDGGTVSFVNGSGTTVTVTNAGDDVGEIPADGGGAVHTDDCIGAPVVVTYDGGRVVELDRPVCPGQELRIGSEAVSVRQSGADDPG